MSVVVVRKPAAECRVQLLIAAGSRSSVHCSDLMSTVAICGMWSGDPALCSSGSTSKYYNFGLYAFKFKYDQWRPATLRYVRQVALFSAPGQKTSELRTNQYCSQHIPQHNGQVRRHFWTWLGNWPYLTRGKIALIENLTFYSNFISMMENDAIIK